MRKELELIEQIEDYLMDKLNPIDKSNFDAKIHSDPGLKSAVEFQQNLVEGIQRMGLKNDSIKARKRYRMNKMLKVTAISFTVLLAAAVAWYYSQANTEGGWNLFGNNPVEQVIEKETELMVSLPEEDNLSSEANKYLDQELFHLQTNRDTVIESEEGIVVFIPAKAFDTDNDYVDFLIQEALTPADIMYAGLNTMTADGDSLETGGMFYFDAFANNERVDLVKELTVDVPTDPSKTGMNLYDGIENEAGELLWTNPQPIIKPLVPTEITELDFYPPGYESKMEEWGYLNGKFKDSLYYSFASDCFDDGVDQLLPEENWSSDNDPEVQLDTAITRFQSTEIINGVETNRVEIDTIVSAISPLGMFLPIPQNPEDKMPNNIDDVITWNFEVVYSGSDEATIIMEVDQKNGWHIYSQIQPDGAIPLPTEFNYDEGKNLGSDFKLIGKTKEFGAELDDNQGFPERSFHGRTARFEQKIKILSVESFDISLYYGYMACLTACLPPEFRTERIRINGLSELDDDLCVDCGVNPASVQAIWNSKFNNTNLATKEFEKRMPLIHRTCNNAVLELYVDNLNLNLCTVDSMAMQLVGGSLGKQFAKFASQGKGKVEVTNKAQQGLAAYYETKRRAIQKAIDLTNANYWAEQNELDAEMRNRDEASNRQNIENKSVISKKELDLNMDRVYAEMGLKKPNPPATNAVSFGTSPPLTDSTDNLEPKNATPNLNSFSSIRANVNTMGWKNMDRLMSAARRRQNLNIIRKRANSYTPLNLTIENLEKYQRVNVYVVPTKFNTYIKLNPINGKYTYRMNDNLNYQLAVIGWNEQGMFYSNGEVLSGDRSTQLKSISKAQWENEIRDKFATIKGMSEELNYLEYAKKDRARKNKNQALRDLRDKTRPFVFPCACGDKEQNDEIIIVEDAPESEGNVGFNWNANQVSNTDDENYPELNQVTQIDPQFPGGIGALSAYLNDNIRYPKKAQEAGESGTVYVDYTVSPRGVISNIRVREGVSQAIDAEAVRLIAKMPNWIPGKVEGMPVEVGMTLPITFGLGE